MPLSGSLRGGTGCPGQRTGLLPADGVCCGCRPPACFCDSVSMIRGMSLTPVIMSPFVGACIGPRPGRVREAAAGTRWPSRHAVAAGTRRPPARGGRRHAACRHAVRPRGRPSRPRVSRVSRLGSRVLGLTPSCSEIRAASSPRPIVPRYAPGSSYRESRATAVESRGLRCPRRAQERCSRNRETPRSADDDSVRSVARTLRVTRRNHEPRRSAAAMWSPVATRGPRVGRLQPMNMKGRHAWGGRLDTFRSPGDYDRGPRR